MVVERKVSDTYFNENYNVPRLKITFPQRKNVHQ